MFTKTLDRFAKELCGNCISEYTENVNINQLDSIVENYLIKNQIVSSTIQMLIIVYRTKISV